MPVGNFWTMRRPGLGAFWSVGSGGGSGGTGQLRDGSPKPPGGHVAQAQGAPSFVGLGV